MFLNNENFWVKGGSAQPFVKVKASLEIEIPLPPLEVQREIIAEIEDHQTEIRNLKIQIAEHEKAIESVIARVWGDEGHQVAGDA